MRRASLLVFAALAFLPSAAWSQGDPLGPEFRVNTYTTGSQFRASVAAASSGGFVVVWDSGQDGIGQGVFGQRYAASGVPLGPEFRVNTYTTDNQYLPDVVADASGNFVVIWTSYRQEGLAFSTGVFGQRYDSAGAALGPEFRVNTYTTDPQRFASIASDASGNFVVVWASTQPEGGGPGIGVFGQRYASAGTPLGSEFLVNTYTTGPQFSPSVASDTAGNFIVVWASTDQDGDATGVFGQRYAFGALVGPEFRVNTYTTAFQSYPSVAADAAGNFVVVWQSQNQDGSDYGVFGQRYASSGAPLGPEFRVNTYTTNLQFDPSVVSDSSGNFVVSWASYPQDGSHFAIVAQRYASSGAPLGPEFLVNTYTTNAQRRPSLASDALGNFVVTWDSQGQDGSQEGVFGQRYSQIVPVDLMDLRVE